MKKYIIAIAAAISLAFAYNKYTETQRERDRLFNIEVRISGFLDNSSLSISPDKFRLKEIEGYSYPSQKTPLTALTTLLESYELGDSSVSEKIAPNPEKVWRNFYQTSECKRLLKINKTKYVLKDLEIKSDTESPKTTINLNGESFVFEAGYFLTDDLEWRLR